MKTVEIMKPYEYECNQGSIRAIPVEDVVNFCKRIRDRLFDIQDGLSIEFFDGEIVNVIRTIE